MSLPGMRVPLHAVTSTAAGRAVELGRRGSRNHSPNLLKMGLFFILSLGEGVHTRGRRGTRQRGGPTSEFTAAGPAREARSQKLSCGQNERKRSSDRTPSDLARDECSSRRVSFGVRSCLSARRRSDCRRRFVFCCALVGGFAGFGFWFSFLLARFLLSRCLDVIVLGLPKGTRGTA